MRILLAEDEPELALWLIRALAQGGWQVDWVDDGRLVVGSLDALRYDAIVLDLGLPGMDGTRVLQELARLEAPPPVLVLTARDSLRERVSVLHGGADDFLAKPFALAELEARLVALVRRQRGRDPVRFVCGPLRWDSAARRFWLDEQPLALSPRETAVLRCLIMHVGQPVAKQDILQRVFSDEVEVQPEAIEVLIHRLRRRLDGSCVRISTLRGLGYVLESVPAAATPPADPPLT